MIDLHRLAGFHLVATSGGYAKAARAAAYPITQPALHQQVKKLEAEVGVELLMRVGKDTMQPTPAGQRLLDFVTPFFRDLPRVVEGVRTGDYDGALTIHAESLLIRQLLPGWLLALRKRRPKAQLTLQELLQVDVDVLRRGAADVMLAHLTEIPDDIAAQQVATGYACLVVPKANAPRRGKPRRWPSTAWRRAPRSRWTRRTRSSATSSPASAGRWCRAWTPRARAGDGSPRIRGASRASPSPSTWRGGRTRPSTRCSTR
jgi:DNA-binding transcriptional LysR family regulator